MTNLGNNIRIRLIESNYFKLFSTTLTCGANREIYVEHSLISFDHINQIIFKNLV